MQAQRRSPLSGRAKALIALALIAAAACAALIAFRPAAAPRGGQTVSYEVVDASLTRTTFSVVPDRTRPISCAVQATNDYDGVVGYIEVELPADPEADAAHPASRTVDIRTTQLAASGHLVRCAFVEG